MMKNGKMMLYIPLLCSLAVVGRVMWSSGTPSTGDMSHRLALEKKSLRAAANERRLTPTDSATVVMDISVEDSGHLDLEVSSQNLDHFGKAGKASPIYSEAIAFLDELSQKSKFQPSVERRYLFPNNIELNPFAPSHIFEILLDISTPNGEHIETSLHDGVTGNKLVFRTATEHGKVVYMIPLTPGKYKLIMKDSEGNVLTGKNGGISTFVNQQSVASYDEGIPESDQFGVESSGPNTATVTTRRRQK